MDSQILIDAVVRQSMVLIAQLSTAVGARSPLTRVADEVFLSVTRELEDQGLGGKVVAELFGLALRSYRQKVGRLSESLSARGRTLWGAVHAFLAEREGVSRGEILRRFASDDEGLVDAVLDDLVESGLVCRSGEGKEARFRTADARGLEALGLAGAANSPRTNEALLWVHVFNAGPLRKDELAALVPIPPSAIDAALESLTADGRIRSESLPGGLFYSTDRCLIPVGEPAGWEAAIIDHHRAVLNALAAKAVSGNHRSAPNDEVGGATFRYDLWPGHPKEAEVRELLASTRQRLAALWNEVEDQNRNGSSKATCRVTFYCGQYLTEEAPGE